MNFFDLIKKRRSIRKYQNRPVEPEKVALIIEAALRAPSSRGLNPWEFIIVDNPEAIRELSRAKPHGSAFLGGAPLAVVACANPQKSDVWVEDAAVASAYISLAAEALGLGNCWIQIREREHGKGTTAEEFVRGVLRIPQGLKVESIIAIGYPDEPKPGHSREELHYEKTFVNGFGQK
jgi:nitroreductase